MSASTFYKPRSRPFCARPYIAVATLRYLTTAKAHGQESVEEEVQDLPHWLLPCRRTTHKLRRCYATIPSNGSACVHGIEHRLTKPNHPWTNRQVERMNRRFEEATVQRYHYKCHAQLPR